MRQTPLYETHVALKARMVEFGGWNMPVQYASIIDEHRNVRRAAGLFDIDHMGQMEVQGPDALPYLQRLLTFDVSVLQMNQAHYSLVCYADGGIVDDIFVYRFPDRYFLAINAANTEKDYQWFLYHTRGFGVDVKDISDSTYMLALQGPKAQAILQKLTTADLNGLQFHYALEDRVAGIPTIIARTGYTGEDGFELFFPVAQGKAMWDRIMEAGKPLGLWPIGLAARDSLRFEPKMPLYGQEIASDINPLEAGLGWAVDFDKGEFIGREALLKVKLEGPRRKLVGFEMVERGVPRHNYELARDGKAVGYVTTGMYSPTLDKNLGLGYVPVELSTLGTEIDVIVRGKPVRAKIVRTPFYTPAYKR
ncbi:MAG: glycine cleavage system aminomethyltransferase GcvT [Chloroflexi bacterium]|nr:glycine cleavage system aminomethyltransferase GcvT [Chloroflexota bacterium]